MATLRTIVLFVAVILTAILAGLFLTYAFTIMPGLATTDDRTFVAAFQGLERMFGGFDHGVNWSLVLGFFLGPIVTLAAILVYPRRPIVWWLIAALVLLIITWVITVTANVPMNDALSAAGDPNVIDVARVRADFDEDRWRSLNLIRCVTSTGAFCCLVLALYLHGRRVGSKSRE